MNHPDRPPFMPFSDEEGYYVRDPKAVLIRTDEQFRTFAAHLLALSEGIEAVDTAIPPDKQVLVQTLRDELRQVTGNTKLLLALVRELAAYNIQLTQQRQTSRAAYTQGLKDKYTEILSYLHPADHRMLRWIIEHIEAEDAASLDDTF